MNKVKKRLLNIKFIKKFCRDCEYLEEHIGDISNDHHVNAYAKYNISKYSLKSETDIKCFYQKCLLRKIKS